MASNTIVPTVPAPIIPHWVTDPEKLLALYPVPLEGIFPELPPVVAYRPAVSAPLAGIKAARIVVLTQILSPLTVPSSFMSGEFGLPSPFSSSSVFDLSQSDVRGFGAALSNEWHQSTLTSAPPTPSPGGWAGSATPLPSHFAHPNPSTPAYHPPIPPQFIPPIPPTNASGPVPRPPLADSTNFAGVGAEQPVQFVQYNPPTAQKRAASGAAPGAPARKRTTRARGGGEKAKSAVSDPALFAAGPSTAPPSSLPNDFTTDFGSMAEEESAEHSGHAATHIWFCVDGVHSETAPNVVPPPEPEPSMRPPPEKVFSRLRCRFCYSPNPKHDVWQTWKNKHNGATSTIERHLRKHHPVEWAATIIKYKLKGWEKLQAELAKGTGSAAVAAMDCCR
ncbi:hypothetical protein HMN09_01085300 [Mycena chlorophos]|uniref:Uncharacterized protein n=1 Tax=Mycena chlorophos TaxID=658473 RepID=A0A8H6SC23_MYCCL|nr:hypothetical protein HMN09_01085300 [Mycena chlorophos]